MARKAKPAKPTTADPPIAAPSVNGDARAERFRERIREFRRVRAGDVDPHPLNPRLHSAAQLAAVTGLLVDVGKFRPLVAFPADGLGPAGDFSRLMYADGHGRRAIDPNEVWTFAVTDLTRAEADEALFADRTGELAGYDPVILDSLLRDVNTGCEELQAMLAELAEETGVTPPNFDPATADEQGRLDEKAKIKCPECGHEFTT
jgi:hypothetical protein